MSDLIFHHFQTGLPPEILRAFDRELRSGGVSEGIFCMGPAPLDQGLISMMWVFSKDVRNITTVPRAAFENLGSVQITAREFAQECRERWEQLGQD